jgi:hypothetical protein
LCGADNDLIFQSRRFRSACLDYRLGKEFITPYTPEQNGIIERFFRSLKEECTWQWNFGTFSEARRALRRWIRWYNEGSPVSLSATRARLNTELNNSTRWLDFRGALHPFARAGAARPSKRTADSLKNVQIACLWSAVRVATWRLRETRAGSLEGSAHHRSGPLSVSRPRRACAAAPRSMARRRRRPPGR